MVKNFAAFGKLLRMYGYTRDNITESNLDVPESVVPGRDIRAYYHVTGHGAVVQSDGRWEHAKPSGNYVRGRGRASFARRLQRLHGR